MGARRLSPISIRGAAVIQLASKYSSIVIQLAVTMVLARLISPEDFGLLAIVTVFTALFSVFSDMGIGVAIVQFRDLEEEDFGALFAFSVILAVAMAFLFCCSSFFIAWFYEDNRLVSICCLTSLSLVFATLNMVPNGLMLRERRFLAMGVRTVVSAVLSGVVAIILAFAEFGYWALVAQIIISSAVIFFWNIATRPIRKITIHFLKPLQRIFSYSAYQFGSMFINYFSRNLDNLLIGKVMGAAALGCYDKSYKLTTYPMSAFSSVIASVVQPYMAEHQNQPERIFSCWFKLTKGISLVAVFVAAVFFSASSEVIELFYGPQWDEAVPVFAVLSISIYFQMMGNPSGSFFQSLGRTDLMFRTMLINTTIMVIGLCIGLAGGSLFTVAIAVTVVLFFHLLLLTYFLIHRGFGESLAKLKAFLPEIVLGILAIGTCSALNSYIPNEIVLSLICKFAIVGLVLIFGYTMTGQFKYLKMILKR